MSGEGLQPTGVRQKESPAQALWTVCFWGTRAPRACSEEGRLYGHCRAALPPAELPSFLVEAFQPRLPAQICDRNKTEPGLSFPGGGSVLLLCRIRCKWILYTPWKRKSEAGHSSCRREQGHLKVFQPFWYFPEHFTHFHPIL